MNLSVSFYKICNLFVLFMLVACGLAGQTLDTTTTARPSQDTVTTPVDDSTIVRIDTTHHKKNFVRRFLDKSYPSPSKAVIFSAIVPGGGQIYNKQAWKLAIWYPLYAGMGYLIYTNHASYSDFQNALEIRLNNGIDKYYYLISSIPALKSYRDSYRLNFELSCVGMVLVHALQVTDAYVSAHLKLFDMSDDISMNARFKSFLTPSTLQGAVPSIGLSFAFEKNKPKPLF